MSNNPKVSNIEIIVVRPQKGLVGFTSFVLENYLFIGEVAIYNCVSSPCGYRLVYPAKKLRNGANKGIVYPTNKQAGDLITRAIAEEFKKINGSLRSEIERSDKEWSYEKESYRRQKF